MKIYTITCNNAYNYGAVLQAYALQEFIKKSGHDVKIIDYYPKNLRKISERYKNHPLIILARKILYFPDYHKSKIVFNKFSSKHLCLTRPCYSLKDIKKLPVADLYIAGSDQIWNPVMKNAEEDAYFLFGDIIGKKMSYAASVGLIEMEESFINKIRNRTCDYVAISIREKITSDLLNIYGIDNTQVIDPVYLLSSNEWKRKMGVKRKNLKYVLVYALHHVQEIYNYAKALAYCLNAEVYVISVEIKEMLRGNDKFFWNPEVNEFVSLIANAEAVVTNSFHGISFACILNVPVHIFNTEKNDPRISSIIDLLKIKNRLCNLAEKKCLVNSINADTTKIIECEKERSGKWLLDKINKIENDR